MSVKLRKVNAQIRDPDKNNQLVPFGLLGSDAVETIESAKTQAISEIETKRATSLASIPNDYSTLAQDVSDLKGDLSESVRFDIVQNKTDAEKARARANIGASDGLSVEAKNALLNCFKRVAWVVNDGMSFYAILKNALGMDDVWEWDSDTDIDIVFYEGLIGSYSYNDTNTIKLEDGNKLNRRELLMLGNEFPILDESGESSSIYQLIPIPDDADSITIGFSPIANYIAVRQLLGTQDQYIFKSISDSGWQTGGSFTEPVFVNSSNGRANGLCVHYRLNGGGEISENPHIIVKFHDIFDTWVRKYTESEWNLVITPAGCGQRLTDYNQYEPLLFEEGNTRASFWLTVGRTSQKSVFLNNSETRSDYYAIPVPDEATSVTVTIAPSSYYISVRSFSWKEDGDVWQSHPETGWKQGTATLQFSDLPSGYDHRYITINCKFNSSGTSGNLPTSCTIMFN